MRLQDMSNSLISPLSCYLLNVLLTSEPSSAFVYYPLKCTYLTFHRCNDMQCARASSHIVSGRLVLRGSLDGVGQKAEDSSDPQQDGEASKELSAEFDPFRGGGGWGESVGSITSEILRSFSVSQTL